MKDQLCMALGTFHLLNLKIYVGIRQVSFSKLTEHLTADMLIKVFSAMVLERRLLFTAQHLRSVHILIL